MASESPQPLVAPGRTLRLRQWKAGTALVVSAGTWLAYVIYAVLALPRLDLLGPNTVISLSFLGDIPVAAAILVSVLALADRRENKAIAILAIVLDVLAGGAPGVFIAVALL